MRGTVKAAKRKKASPPLASRNCRRRNISSQSMINEILDDPAHVCVCVSQSLVKATAVARTTRRRAARGSEGENESSVAT